MATIASMKLENYPHAQFQFNQGLNRGKGNGCNTRGRGRSNNNQGQKHNQFTQSKSAHSQFKQNISETYFSFG